MKTKSEEITSINLTLDTKNRSLIDLRIPLMKWVTI